MKKSKTVVVLKHTNLGTDSGVLRDDNTPFPYFPFFFLQNFDNAIFIRELLFFLFCDLTH